LKLPPGGDPHSYGRSYTDALVTAGVPELVIDARRSYIHGTLEALLQDAVARIDWPFLGALQLDPK
jgi:hypothetical protein